MAFILIPKTGEDIVINAWNWRPTLRLLLDAKLIDEDLYESMAIHGKRGSVGADTACRIADFLDLRLARMKEGERIRADLTTTSEPKKQVIFRSGMLADEVDAVDLHSATYEWLAQFCEFCRRSGGFTVS